jgi:hypothetical protein
MEFVRFDAGDVLRKGRGGQGPKILRLVVGNPLIMKKMVRTVPDAAAYAPVTILVDERADGVQLVREHIQKQQDLTVLDDHGQNVVHARGLIARPPRRIGARENWLIALRAPLPDAGGISRSRPVAHHPDRERAEVNAPGRDTERVPEEQTRQTKEWITGRSRSSASATRMRSRRGPLPGVQRIHVRGGHGAGSRRRDDPALSRVINSIQAAQEV